MFLIESLQLFAVKFLYREAISRRHASVTICNPSSTQISANATSLSYIRYSFKSLSVRQAQHTVTKTVDFEVCSKPILHRGFTKVDKVKKSTSVNPL